jgi:hypothetical protein
VPRHQLGKIVPQIGDRQFAWIAQSFLHDEVDNKITLGHIEIYPPSEWNNYRTKLFAYPKCARSYSEPWYTRSLQLVLPDVEMPANIKNFLSITLRFATPFVINKK